MHARTGGRQISRDADDFISRTTTLQTLELDLVLFKQSGRERSSVPLNVLAGSCDDRVHLVRSCDLLEGSEREADDAGCK